MNKSYATFGTMALILLIMFLFVRSMMTDANEKIKKIDHQRKTEGGSTPKEKEIYQLLHR